MNIALPVDGKNMPTVIGTSFGRAKYFLVYNIDTKENYFIDNSAAASQGGAGIQAAQIIADSHIDAVITPRCGENAAKVLKEAGILIYKSLDNSIPNNMQALEDGKLSLLDEIHAGFHHHGGK